MPTEDGSTILRRRFLALSGTGLGATALAGCLGDDDDDSDEGDSDGDDGDSDDGDADSDGDDGDDGEPGGSLLIGGVHPYTGPFAPHAQAFTAGFDYRIDEVNADGMLDWELTHDAVDSELNPQEAVTIATQFIEQDDAIALTGPVSSDVGIPVADVAEDFEVPLMLDMVGSHEAITNDSRYTYRLGLLPAPTSAEAAAQFIEERDLEVVRAIIADYAYGRAYESAMEELFPDDLDFEIAVAPFEEDSFTSYLRDMPDEVDALIATSHPPGAYSIQTQRLEVGMEAEYVLGIGDSKLTWDAMEEDATDGWLALHQPDPYKDLYGEVAQSYYDETEERFGLVEALGYTAASLLAAGIEEGGDDPMAVSDAIRGIELDSLFAEPIQYTEWGELDQKRIIFSSFETGAPEYYPDGEFVLEEEFATEPVEGFDPSEFDAP